MKGQVSTSQEKFFKWVRWICVVLLLFTIISSCNNSNSNIAKSNKQASTPDSTVSKTSSPSTSPLDQPLSVPTGIAADNTDTFTSDLSGTRTFTVRWQGDVTRMDSIGIGVIGDDLDSSVYGPMISNVKINNIIVNSCNGGEPRARRVVDCRYVDIQGMNPNAIMITYNYSGQQGEMIETYVAPEDNSDDTLTSIIDKLHLK